MISVQYRVSKNDLCQVRVHWIQWCVTPSVLSQKLEAVSPLTSSGDVCTMSKVSCLMSFTQSTHCTRHACFFKKSIKVIVTLGHERNNTTGGLLIRNWARASRTCGWHGQNHSSSVQGILPLPFLQIIIIIYTRSRLVARSKIKENEVLSSCGSFHCRCQGSCILRIFLDL